MGGWGAEGRVWTVTPAGAALIEVLSTSRAHATQCGRSHLQVIRPAKLWCDTESTQEARELSKALGFTLVSKSVGYVWG